MSDKKANIDKQLADQAWKEMRKLLDAELPASQPARRMNSWKIIAALMLLILGGIAVMFLQTKTEEATIPNDFEKRGSPVALDSDLPANNRQGNLARAELVPKGHEETAGQRISSFSEKKEMGNGDGQSFENQEIRRQDDLTTAQNEEENQNANASAGLNEISEEMAETFERQAAPVALSGAELTPVLSDEIFENSLPYGGVSPFSSQRSDWSIYGFGIVGVLGQSSGFGLGVQAAYPIRTSRFSINTGLAVSFVQLPLAIGLTDPGSVNSSVFDNANVRLDSKAYALSEAGLAEAKIVRPLNLFYLNIPLELSYRATPSLSLKGGVRNGFLVFTSSEYAEGGLIPSGQKMLMFDALESQNFGVINAEVRTRLRNYECAAFAGIGWDVSRRISLDLLFQTTLSDLIKNNSKKDNYRFAELKLAYRLGAGAR